MVVSVIRELKVVSEYKRSRDRLPSRESSTCCGGRAQFFFHVLNLVFSLDSHSFSQNVPNGCMHFDTDDTFFFYSRVNSRYMN